MAHYFNDTPFHAASWFRASGLLPGQVWTGLFRKAAGRQQRHRVRARTLPGGRTLDAGADFIGFQPMKGNVSADLPKGTYRITLQWRKAHDPSSYRSGTLPGSFGQTVRLVVMHQRDPQGKLLATDR